MLSIEAQDSGSRGSRKLGLVVFRNDPIHLVMKEQGYPSFYDRQCFGDPGI